MKIEYPKWLYSAKHEPVLVQDEAAHKALGAGWVESPAEVETKKGAHVVPPAHVVDDKEGHHDKHGHKKAK